MKNIKVKTTLLMKAIIVTLALTGGNGWTLDPKGKTTPVNSTDKKTSKKNTTTAVPVKGICTCESTEEVKEINEKITKSECTVSKCKSFLKDGDKRIDIVYTNWNPY